jgi:hypothetical protein
MKDFVKIAIHKLIDKEINHLQDKVMICMRKNEQALGKASKEMNRRLEGMNAFRQQLEEQEKTYIPREEYMARHELLDSKVQSLSKLVYIGLGVVMALEFIIPIVIHLLSQK